jgi:hypothetical protein
MTEKAQPTPPPPVYAPYADGRGQLAMGLMALDPGQWIEIDGNLPTQLAIKRELLQAHRDEVLAALPESRAGAAETRDLLLAHLIERFPDRYRRTPAGIESRMTGESLAIAGFADAPLELAGRLVQEDFCLMQAGEGGYRLVSACLCFPSRWRLGDKLGQPLRSIHGPVPHYAERLARPVDNFFGLVKAERPVWRINWTIHDTPTLFQPDPPAVVAQDIDAANAGDRLWVRVERQTLRRLPVCGDVLFTIRTYVDPLRALAAQPALARGLAATIRDLSPQSARYKNLLAYRDAALAYLDGVAGL